MLCIDGRSQVLTFRKATLKAHGYYVKLASSGYTAIKTLEKTPVAAVLVEYQQEGIDVGDHRLPYQAAVPNLTIILLSAYSEVPERMLRLVDEYVVMKSEMPGRLISTLERARILRQHSDEGKPRRQAAM